MKRIERISCLIVMFTFVLICNLKAYALKEETHEAINQGVAKRTIDGFSLNSYLKDKIGFQKGAEEPVYGYSGFKERYTEQEVFEWLGEGGFQEDRPGSISDYILRNPTRSVNHFHNPLKTNWNEAGLNDELPLIGSYTGLSSVLWAQISNQSPGGTWSWGDAREYFFIALTGKDFTGNNVAPLQGETEEEKRARYFADTFRAVGQQMHLVEDASVPQHVRNDIHVVPAYEAAVEQMRTDRTKYPYQWNDWMNNPISFDKAILNIPSYTPVPISRIIDTDKYTGANPNITTQANCSVTTGITCTTDSNCPSGEICVSTIGISEYTNANFLSEDTIFTDGIFQSDPHYFPYPRRAAAILWKDGFNNRPYFKKESEGETVYHLATVGFAGLQRLKYFPQYNIYFPVDLDDICYEEYATKLIPRAVGYSAGLLNYFFRGTLEITPPDQVAYAVTDGSQTPYLDTYGNLHQQFTSIKAKVRNSTPDTIQGEEVQNCNQIQGNCIIQAIAKYKIIPNYMYDLSNYPPDGATMHNIEYSYSVSGPIYIDSLDSTTPQEFSFDFTNDPIPAGITDLYLQVVFKGTLGSEADIAVAVGMKDLMEPTHQVFWNLTDMFSLYIQQDTAYHLYLANYNSDYPQILCIRYDLYPDTCDQGLFNIVDFNHNGIPNEGNEPYVDPYSTTFGIGYLSGPPQQGGIFYYSAITALQSGRHIRLIALMDKPQDNYLVLTTDDMFGISYFYFTSVGVVNQEVDGVWQTPTPMTTFRYGLDIDGVTPIPIRQHFYTGIINCYPVGADPYGNPACSYPEEEAIPAELSPSPIDDVYYYSPQTVFFDELTTQGLDITKGQSGQGGVAAN